jgi:hypothetical protein
MKNILFFIYIVVTLMIVLNGVYKIGKIQSRLDILNSDELTNQEAIKCHSVLLKNE